MICVQHFGTLQIHHAQDPRSLSETALNLSIATNIKHKQHIMA